MEHSILGESKNQIVSRHPCKRTLKSTVRTNIWHLSSVWYVLAESRVRLRTLSAAKGDEWRSLYVRTHATRSCSPLLD